MFTVHKMLQLWQRWLDTYYVAFVCVSQDKSTSASLPAKRFHMKPNTTVAPCSRWDTVMVAAAWCKAAATRKDVMALALPNDEISEFHLKLERNMLLFSLFPINNRKKVPTDTKKRSSEPRRTAWSQGCWLPYAAKKQSRKGPHRRALLASNHMPQHRHPLLSLPAALGSVRFGATRLSKWKHMKVRGSLLKNGAWMPPREFTHPEGSKPS